ncbi:putative zinc finger protein [Cryptosporidium felis]|nr:putative zinc finger protein [Cryptosporidium felis]
MKLYPKGTGNSVLIESTTSSGESHGLYDYEKKTKFNQVLSVDDTNDSYIIYIDTETGQLIIQPESINKFGHASTQNEKPESSGAIIRNIQDFGKEFLPIIRLFFAKNLWYIEVIKDINRQLRATNAYSIQPSPNSSDSTDFYLGSLPKAGSDKVKGQIKEDNRIWVVTPENSPGIPLFKGDLLKFGRCKMIIHDVITTSSAAKEECSKLPFLPLTGSESLMKNVDSFLQVTPSEAENYQFVENYSKYHAHKGIFYNSSKDVSAIDDLTNSIICNEFKSGSKIVTSSSVSNIATQEDLNNLSKHECQNNTLVEEKKVFDDFVNGLSVGVQFDNSANESKAPRYLKDTTQSGRCCRICLSGDDDNFNDTNERYNPLICPCDCRGSMKYIHLQCLRTWLESRLEIPPGWFLHTWEDLNESYNEVSLQGQSDDDGLAQTQIRERLKHKVLNLFKKWALRFSGSSNKVNSPACLHVRKFDCELCKVSFPTQLKVDMKILGSPNPLLLPLFRVPRPKFPYLVLVPIDGDITSRIGQIIVSFGGSGASVCIGRGHSSDIKLGEISVSRTHAQLQHCYIGGSHQICLMDLKSKFGSLIEFTRPIKLGKESLSIQMGKTLISFKTFKSSGSVSNIVPYFSGCIGRRDAVGNSREFSCGSIKTTKSVNLTLDSPSEMAIGNSELLPPMRNMSSFSNIRNESCILDQGIKQLQPFRNLTSNSGLPQRHCYIFNP